MGINATLQEVIDRRSRGESFSFISLKTGIPEDMLKRAFNKTPGTPTSGNIVLNKEGV